MKITIKATLIALAAAGVAASAQAASYPEGDLIIGFTVQSGNDYELDLGLFSGLSNGQTWDLNSALTTANPSLLTSAVRWGVIGSDFQNSGLAWTTKQGAVPPTALTAAKDNNQDLSISSLYSLFPSAGSGASATTPNGGANAWNSQTTGSSTTSYNKRYQNPNLIGFGTTTLWQSVGDGSAAVDVGTFSFANNGIVTFDAVAVPEPSTDGLVAGAGLLAVCLRNQFRRKQA